MLLTGSLQFSFITYYVIRIAIIIFQRACADELMSTVTNLFIWLLVIRGRPIIGADIKHFTDYRYRPF